MNIEHLQPAPPFRRPFRLAHQKFVPGSPGCYVLTTFQGIVLYVGLTGDLRRRMGEHLDSPEKRACTSAGRAVWFHWLETTEANKVERTWMNIHALHEGKLPVLNHAYSATPT